MNNKSSSLLIGFVIVVIILFAIFVLPKMSGPNDVNPPDGSGSQLAPQAGLPPAVENKRQAIYTAAVAHDYDALIALQTEGQFSYTFGGSYEGGFGAWLRYIDSLYPEETTFDIIPELLALPYEYTGAETDIYVWPSFFLRAAEDWTEEDLVNMRKILTEEEIQGFREVGAYIGHRIGIKSDGTWIYYIAGD